jgi:rhomboid protease GluP
MPLADDLAGTTVRCERCGEGRVTVADATGITAPVPACAAKTINTAPDTAVADRRVSAVSEPLAGPHRVALTALSAWLRSCIRRWPVTCTLVAANVLLFAAMALSFSAVFHFSERAVLTWGGGLAPRVYGGQWWRAGTYMFQHGDLRHLVGNLFFLLLIAPLMERLLGSAQFALVYLFAGLGGGLLVMGAYPQQVAVGASAAVYGVYGALLGCCLRGPRSIPRKVVAQRTGLVLLFVVFSIVQEWLDVGDQPTAHLGGFVFGLVGGLLCGHELQPRAARWKPWRLALVATVCSGLISATAWWVHGCAAKALGFYERFAKAKDLERQVRGRFDEALHRRVRGKITSVEWKEVLETSIIPAFRDMRAACDLQLTGDLAELEGRNFSMQDFWGLLRSRHSVPKSESKKPLTVEEYGQAYRILCKLRLDSWQALANELPEGDLLGLRALTDARQLALLGAALDEAANEGICCTVGPNGARHAAAQAAQHRRRRSGTGMSTAPSAGPQRPARAF